MKLWKVTISPVVSVQRQKPGWPARVFGGDAGWGRTYHVVAGDDGLVAMRAAMDALRKEREGVDEETGDVTTVLRVNLLGLEEAGRVDIYVDTRTGDE